MNTFGTFKSNASEPAPCPLLPPPSLHRTATILCSKYGLWRDINRAHRSRCASAEKTEKLKPHFIASIFFANHNHFGCRTRLEALFLRFFSIYFLPRFSVRCRLLTVTRHVLHCFPLSFLCLNQYSSTICWFLQAVSWILHQIPLRKRDFFSCFSPLS